ncbi:MAG TPA: glycine zipper 2TM domain-containing protein [Accumulibacter sp.]|nr:glycine zipper 2TM domain-containing protein [Accumulibacter sp.]
MNLLRMFFLMLVSVTLVACVSSQSASVYSPQQARQEMTVRQGTVESVREVIMQGSKSGVGTLAGAAVGGVAGSNIGGGKGQIVGAILGAVAGGLAGSAIEEGATRKVALEVTVRLNGGQLVAVVQETDERFLPGERVRLLSRGGDTRVTH